MIYLDYNATAPLRASVARAMDAVALLPLNASSVHSAGRKAKKLLEDARAEIADALGAFPNEVIFTASGSEANNLALRGFPDRPLLVSAVEHASVRKTGALLGASTLPVDGNGVLDLAVLDAQLKSLGHSALVSVMLANNETGVIQPIAEIAAIVHKHGGLLHCDAVQALGKLKLDWGLLKADMLTISGHKVGGPLGAAALLVRNDLPIRPLITGGGQELGRRAGTENIAAITGFAVLVTEVIHSKEAIEYAALRDRFEAKVREFGQIFGKNVERLSNTSQIAMPGVRNETQLMHFDLSGFAVSAGSACSSGRIEASQVLLAMGVPATVAETAIRVSIGWGTTEAEIDAFAEAWRKASAQLGKSRAA